MPDIPIFAEGLDLAPEIRDELAEALEFREACRDLLEIRQQAAEAARAALVEAESLVETTNDDLNKAARHRADADDKVRALMRGSGLVFTADGIQRIIPLVVEGIAQAAHAAADEDAAAASDLWDRP